MQHSSLYSVDGAEIKGFRSASLSFIDRIYGANHTYFKEFDNNTNGYYTGDVERGVLFMLSN